MEIYTRVVNPPVRWYRYLSLKACERNLLPILGRRRFPGFEVKQTETWNA